MSKLGERINAICRAYEREGAEGAQRAFAEICQPAKAWEARAIREHVQRLIADGVIRFKGTTA